MSTERLEPRIKAAAAVAGKDVNALLAHLNEVVADVADVEVATNADATAFGLSLPLAADPYLAIRMTNLQSAITSSTALVKAAELRAPRLMRVERGIGPQGRPATGLGGVFSTAYYYEPHDLTNDVELGRALGLPPPAVDAAARRLRTVTGSSSSTVRLSVYTGLPPANTQFEIGAPVSSAALVDKAELTGIDGDDLTMLRVLAELGIAIAWVTVTNEGMRPGLRVEYNTVGIDDALAVCGKYGDVSRVQALLDALESRAVRSLVLTLGAPSALGPVWLSVAA